MVVGLTPSIDELLALVDQRPQQALDVAAALLAGEPERRDAVQLLWITGLAQRELGHLAASRDALEDARTLALSIDDRPLAARVGISLAYEIGHGGDLRLALELLAIIERDVDEADRPRLANQRGVLHYRLGQLDAAVADLDTARQSAALVGDVGSELRALLNLGAINSQRADHERARTDLSAAIDLAFRHDQVGSAGVALANLAYIETIEGNLPAALDAFAAAEDGYRRAGNAGDLPRLHANHAMALADANLLGDAEALIEEALRLAAATDNDVETAELLMLSAEIHLARGDATSARDAAVDAHERFRRQGRDSWLHVATRARLRAQARLEPGADGVARDLVANARDLDAGGWRSEALAAMLLAALLDAEAGRTDRVAEALAAIGAQAERGRVNDRIVLAHVLALTAERQGDRAAARRAVTSGLRAASAAQAALGSLETRAHAAHHGAALVEVGARLAVGDRRPRELLHRIEAMRTMVWHTPLVRPPDEAMASQLAALRTLNRVLADPETEVDDRQDAERRRVETERAVRDLARRARGAGERPTTTEQAIAEALVTLREQGDRQLLAYANLHGALLAVSADRGRCRLHELGPVEALDEHLEACSFALHRLNRTQGSAASRASAAAMLADAGESLGALLVPPTVAASARPLVVVPTGALHGVAWTALEVLRGREVCVSPSVGGWAVAARADARRAAGPRAAGFIAGPDLVHAVDEVRSLAGIHRRARVLVGGEATAEGCLELFAERQLVHLACHGSFRQDNPLFSTLAMVDGPLTVYDLERVRTMPEVVVLSACSVANATAINGGTLLGLSSALGAFGATDVIAPLTPVNDERVVEVMRRFHRALAAGQSAVAALAAAARDDDGELDPTAAAFVAIGA